MNKCVRVDQVLCVGANDEEKGVEDGVETTICLETVEWGEDRQRWRCCLRGEESLELFNSFTFTSTLQQQNNKHFKMFNKCVDWKSL